MRIIQLTQNKIAFFTSIIGFVISIILLLLIYYLIQPFSKYVFLLCPIIFVSIYIINKIFVELFLIRKINILYKTIQSIQSQKIFTPDSYTDIITSAQENVLTYAKDQEDTINSLKKMEKYRRDFLGNVSHELKTPLFNIQGYLETLLDGGIYDLNINMNYLQKAANNVDRLGRIVDDLVFISLTEAGELKLNKEVFKVRTLFQKIIDDVEQQAKYKKIKIKFKELEEEEANVFADFDRIYQVGYNIIWNALKYCPDKSVINIGIYDALDRIFIEISDNGQGIAEEHLPRLFERFYRVDKSRSREEGGTGLGLSIVKHIIEAHQQTIQVKSKEGHGTSFGFYLSKP